MRLSSKPLVVNNGYISLGEYLKTINQFTTTSGWRLPLHTMDKIQLWFLKVVLRWSWFADSLYVQNPAQYGIGFDQLFNYINQNLFAIGLRRQSPSIQTLRDYQWRLFYKKPNGAIEPFALGVDFEHDVALSKAFGEGLERYFTLLSKESAIKTATITTVRQLQNKKVAYYFPREHHVFTDKQQQAHAFLQEKNDQRIEWVLGENIISGKVTYIPKQLISKAIQKILIPREGMLGEATTSGGAGWFTKEGAVFRGIFELVQRDSFIVAWLTKKKLPAIDLETIPDDQIQKMLKHFKAAQAEVILLKAEAVAQIPTVITIVFDRGFAEEQVYVTAHSDTTLSKAITGSLHEMTVFFNEKIPFVLPKNYQAFVTTGITRTERINLYRGKAWSNYVKEIHSGEHIDFNLAQVDEFRAGADTDILEELLVRLKALGVEYEPIVFTYQHRVLRKVGFYVVKCFIPALFPLYLSEHLAPIKSTRLGTHALTSHEEIIKILNQVPHPFP